MFVRRPQRISILGAAAAVLLAACGGGGGGSSGGNGAPAAGGPPPPPAVNRNPVLALAIAEQRGIQRHPFDFDVTQGGRTFTDPDGDVVTYTAEWSFGTIPGLRIEGTRVVGTTELETAFGEIRVLASDGRGAVSVTNFMIRISANSAPAPVASFDDILLAVGAPLDTNAAAAGAFRDADGDPIAYAVTVRGAPGLSVTGTRVQGSLASVGATEVTVTANDGFGGEAIAHFLVAAPAPEPAAPHLPAPAYAYEDTQLVFPQVLAFEFALYPFDPEPNAPTNAGAALGRVLFHDKRLSITNTVACASCHQQSHGFASPNRFDTGVLGIPLKRNAMTLTNSRVSAQGVFFSDMRAERVRDAIHEAIVSRDELGSRLPRIEAKLRAAPFYEPLFAAAFGTPEITSQRVLLALEQYAQAILSYRSKFDQACLPLDNSPIDCAASFTAQELRGQEIFHGSSGVACTMCHDQWSTTNRWHANNGIDDVVTDQGTVHPGLQRDGSRGVFRAGSLRNIARTAPYMHDGRFATLRDVINHYDHGIKASPNLDALLGNRISGIPNRMDLSEADKDALEAFLNTFTDDDMIADPKFSDPFL
jgi:cytochrome c peroxidase